MRNEVFYYKVSVINIKRQNDEGRRSKQKKILNREWKGKGREKVKEDIK